MLILHGVCSSISGATVIDEQSDVSQVEYIDLVVEIEELLDVCCLDFLVAESLSGLVKSS